jgi:hypothetical protein
MMFPKPSDSAVKEFLDIYTSDFGTLPLGSNEEEVAQRIFIFLCLWMHSQRLIHLPQLDQNQLLKK